MPIPLGAVPEPPSRTRARSEAPNGRMIDGGQADIDVSFQASRSSAFHLHEGDRLLQAWTLRKTSLLRDRSNGDAVRRRPTNPHMLANATVPPPLPGNGDGALARAYGEIVHRSGFSSGRAWSDLLFTMSDNTHPQGRTPGGCE